MTAKDVPLLTAKDISSLTARDIPRFKLEGFRAHHRSEIAYRLDFSDPGTFSRFFKKATGETPLAFREAQDR